MDYFRIFTKGWMLQNKIISANIDLFAGNKIIVADEPFSLTDSIWKLLKSTFTSHILQNNDPLFVCSCGNKFCAGLDFEVMHSQDKVIISKFKKIQDIACYNYTFEISKDIYIKEIVKLCKDYLDFCNAIEWTATNDIHLESIKEKVKSIEMQPDNNSGYLDIVDILKTHKTYDAAKFIKNFNWKIEDVLNHLHSNDEVIRYKCIELLGILQYFAATKIIIEKLKYEEQENIKYAMCRFLSLAGVLKNIEIMDELYLRRFSKHSCKKRNLYLARGETRNILFVFSLLLENEDKRIILAALDAIKDYEIKNNKRILSSLSRIITNKQMDISIRKKAIDIIYKTDNKPILEVIQDKTEKQDIRCWCIQKVLSHNNFDAVLTLQQVLNNKEDEQAIRNLCRQYLTRVEFYRKIKIHHLIFFAIILLLCGIYLLPFHPMIKTIFIITSLSTMIGLVFYELS